MADFWPSSGYRLLRKGEDGRLVVTDDFLRTYLMQPELAPIRESGARELALLKPSAFLINTARGGVIDQRALVAALRERRIAGAGLDVTDPEPPPPDDPLLALENVILTPHVAWYSEESREHVTVHAAREVVRILRGDRPRSPVNEVVPRGAAHHA